MLDAAVIGKQDGFCCPYVLKADIFIRVGDADAVFFAVFFSHSLTHPFLVFILQGNGEKDKELFCFWQVFSDEGVGTFIGPPRKDNRYINL